MKNAILFLVLTVLIFSTNSYSMDILGAGATFPYPFYSKIFHVYSISKNVNVNYQGIGSGGGIQQLINKTVDFGGTDAYMSNEKLASSKEKIVHIPTCLGAVVITYNIHGMDNIKLDASTISKIFRGIITKWNDPEIQKLNANRKIPSMKISVIHRSDGSGTTFIFSDYLTKADNQWSQSVGRGKSLNWPCGIGAKGNSGVAGFIKKIPGSIGYTELIYANKTRLNTAVIKNRSGNFIKASMNSVSNAANIDMPEDTRITITDTDAEKGYPISSFTWIILYNEQNYAGRSKQKAKETLDLLWWTIHEGEKLAPSMEYSPIPENVLKKAENILRSVTYNGKKIL